MHEPQLHPSTSVCQPSPGWGLRTTGNLKSMAGGRAGWERYPRLGPITSTWSPVSLLAMSPAHWGAFHFRKCRSPTALCLPVLCTDLRDHWASTNTQLVPCLFPMCLMKTSTKQSRDPVFFLLEELKVLLYCWARQHLQGPSGCTVSGTTQVAQLANIWATGETGIGMWKAYEQFDIAWGHRSMEGI